jgi:drug/metabolite transporter (DMT)-like permease
MGVALGLLAAVAYGTSDFIGGIGGRRSSVGALAIWSQSMSLLSALVAVLLLRHGGPDPSALAWGAVSGLGAGIGTVALYRGLAEARMGVVSPLSAVIAALLPALVGIASGDRPSTLALVGMAAALPAIVLVSWHGEAQDAGRSNGIGYGLVAGLGFGSLFAALGQAGTGSGAWPLVPGQLVAMAVILPVGLSWAPRPVPWRPAARFGLLAGGLGGCANLIFLTATGAGQLAVVAVLTSLYPAITVLLARAVLDERWRRVQILGLVASAAAVVLITVG